MSARTKRTGSWEANKGVNAVLCFSESGRVFSVSSLFQHRHTDTERICVCMLKKTGNKKNSPRVLQKKQPSTGNTIDADITPVAPNFNVVLGSAEHYEQKWLFFFEGRHTHNSEYNIELGDGGNMTCMVLNFIGWLFFLKNPDSEKHRTAFTPLFASQLPVLCVRADIDWQYAFPGALKHIARTELIQKLLQI